MDASNVPAGPVLTIPDMHRDPQAIARDMIVEVDHVAAGPVKAIGHPVKYSATPAKVTRPAPLLGQHTREILMGAGYSEESVQALIDTGAAIAAGR